MSPLRKQGVVVSNVVTRTSSRAITPLEARSRFPSTPEERFQKLGRGKFHGVNNTSLRFSKGSVVCVGGDDIYSICVHLHMLRNEYNKRLEGDELIVLGPITIQNIVCSDSLDFRVDLNEIHKRNPFDVVYEKGVFPGARCRLDGKKINLFSGTETNNNKFVMVGQRDVDGILRSREAFIELMKDLSGLDEEEELLFEG